MLISRGLSALRRAKNLQPQLNCVSQTIRNSHDWFYRSPSPTKNKNLVLAAEAVQGFAWWWVLWHLWTEPGHILGEFEYPDPSKWTDEELGIPSS